MVLGLTGGKFVSPKIRLLAGAIGAGLTFSAATNTCAMGQAISAMPWNKAAQEPTRESAILQFPVAGCRDPGVQGLMTATLILVLALSVLIGLSLGVLGGGGSILTVPILVYVAGFEAKEAIAASLFVVGVTSAVSVFSHARAGRVMWRTGLLFGAAGMAGAFVGGLLGGHIPGQILLIAFALMMVATSIAMIRGRKKKADAGTEAPKHTELPLFRVLLDGLVVGLVTGLVGAGGGFLVVPALALLGGLPMAIAVGTSLVVIAMKSFAGLAGYLTTVELDWGITLAVTAAAIVGTLIGSKLAGRIPEAALRKGFGWFVLVMGAFVLIQQAPVDLRGPIALGVAGAALVAAAVCWFFVRACPLRKSNRATAPGHPAHAGLTGPAHSHQSLLNTKGITMAEISITEADQRRNQAQLLDVREDFEVAEGMIPGALHIPMGELQARLAELDPKFRSSPSAAAATAAPAWRMPSTVPASPQTPWTAA